MVFPYLKGFDIIEDLKFYLLWCYFLDIFSISIHFLVRSITSGIRELSWAEFGDLFFHFFVGNFGRRDCRANMKILVKIFQK